MKPSPLPLTCYHQARHQEAKEERSPPTKFFCPLKNMLDIVWNYWTWFKNLNPSQKTLLPWCPKLVTGLAITTLEQKFKELARSRKCRFSNQHKNKKGRQLLFILMSSYSILYNVYTYPYYILISNFCVRKIEDMLHLYDFMGVTGPQQFFTFVTGPLLEIIE